MNAMRLRTRKSKNDEDTQCPKCAPDQRGQRLGPVCAAACRDAADGGDRCGDQPAGVAPALPASGDAVPPRDLKPGASVFLHQQHNAEPKKETARDAGEKGRRAVESRDGCSDRHDCQHKENGRRCPASSRTFWTVHDRLPPEPTPRARLFSAPPTSGRRRLLHCLFRPLLR